MICRKFNKFMINYFADTIAEKEKKELMAHIDLCEECKQEFEELKFASDAVSSYFKQNKVPYNTGMEEEIMQNVTAEQTSILSYIKRFFFRFRPVLRPVVISAAFVFIFFIGFYTHSIIQRNKIITEISKFIKINKDTMDFVVFNNIDYIVQLYIQQDNDLAFSNEEDVYANIKYSLYLYLQTKIEKDYLYKDPAVIDNILDKYAGEYLNYIKENHKNILI